MIKKIGTIWISGFLVLFLLVGLLAGSVEEETVGGSTEWAGYNLPAWITDEMMEAFYGTQKEYGVPVSTGLSQAIVESTGSYGAGMSGLAYYHKNLFGIKGRSGSPYVSGVAVMGTQEQAAGGGMYAIQAGFSEYKSYKDCIYDRALMITTLSYYAACDQYKNLNDGKYTKEQANQYCKAFASSWATSQVYYEHNVKIMEQYNLYQFDNLTYEQFLKLKEGGSGFPANVVYNGKITEKMKQVVAIAGGNRSAFPCTANYCAAWVSGVYQAAGLGSISGNAIDMWNNYKYTGSTDQGNIPPGAVVCSSGWGMMGSIYGHVGIYLGNGMVANNKGYFAVETMSEFLAWQTATCQGHTGWIGWVMPINLMD
ncbi:hypothetical protein FYJ34_06750 [Clostridiaceae bacterium 68-1-5]|uniref:Mannosyl-glycoprotein endo-beta-N-acetylglucosamidase-like domain-containing protein n=1 Tax=Suipraeoptans intestinalis TaxID=2606628 RepID=A0A6N7V074_9FIRM|nr:hypothetical protein [Suipraeoptans intestinalis]